MRFNEFKKIVKESATTQTITVHFTDGTTKTITDIPMPIFTDSNFEQSLKAKMNKNFSNREYSRFTTKLEFNPTTEEKQHMDNVDNLFTLIRAEIAKLFDGGKENTPFPDDISFSYRIGDSNKSIPDVKKEFNITTYNNTRDPKSDKWGVLNAEGWPVSMGDYVELKQKIIDKLGAGNDIVLGNPPSEAQRPGERAMINVGGTTLQYKRELDMYKRDA